LTELEFGHAHPDFPMAVLPQARTEALLADALAVFGVVPERGTALGSFEQDNDGVDAVLISLIDPTTLSSGKIRTGWLQRTQSFLLRYGTRPPVLRRGNQFGLRRRGQADRESFRAPIMLAADGAQQGSWGTGPLHWKAPASRKTGRSMGCSAKKPALRGAGGNPSSSADVTKLRNLSVNSISQSCNCSYIVSVSSRRWHSWLPTKVRDRSKMGDCLDGDLTATDTCVRFL
jgi:hypothetical protein